MQWKQAFVCVVVSDVHNIDVSLNPTFLSGRLNRNSRSKRPGLLSAGSIESSLFVAPMTNISPRLSKPSIKANRVDTIELDRGMEVVVQNLIHANLWFSCIGSYTQNYNEYKNCLNLLQDSYTRTKCNLTPHRVLQRHTAWQLNHTNTCRHLVPKYFLRFRQYWLSSWVRTDQINKAFFLQTVHRPALSNTHIEQNRVGQKISTVLFPCWLAHLFTQHGRKRRESINSRICSWISFGPEFQ